MDYTFFRLPKASGFWKLVLFLLSSFRYLDRACIWMLEGYSKNSVLVRRVWGMDENAWWWCPVVFVVCRSSFPNHWVVWLYLQLLIVDDDELFPHCLFCIFLQGSSVWRSWWLKRPSSSVDGFCRFVGLSHVSAQGIDMPSQFCSHLHMSLCIMLHATLFSDDSCFKDMAL
jgi:hypothetical protein